MWEQLGSGAPRLRAGALIAVGVVVLALVVFAVRRPDVTVTGSITPDGYLCVVHDGRVWISTETVTAPGEVGAPVQGSWSDSGPQGAQLTTPTGRTIDLRTDEAAGDGADRPDDDGACNLVEL